MTLRRAGIALAAGVVALGLVAGCSTSTKGTGTEAGSLPAAASTSGPSSASGPSSPSSTPSASGTAGASAGQLFMQSQAALAGASSVHVAGSVDDGGDQVSLDLGFAANGTSGAVTVDGNPIQLIVIGPDVYFRAPDAFWRKYAGAAADQVLKQVSGKWIKTSTGDSSFGSLSEIADRKTFAAEVFSGESASSVTQVAGKTIGGVATIGLQGSDGVLYVATDDSRPIAIESSSASSAGGQLAFDHYNAVPPVATPSPSETIDASKLGG